MPTTIKIVVILLSAFVLGIYAAPNFANEDEITKCEEEQDINLIIRMRELLTEVLVAIKYDPEVKIAFEHIGSSEYQTKIDRLALKEEYLDFLDYCRRNNLTLPEVINFARAVLLPSLISQSTTESFPGVNKKEIIGGVHGMVIRIVEKYSLMDDFRHFIQDRFECDPEFREKVNNLRSREFQKLLKNLRSTDEYIEIVKDLAEYKIYIEIYLNALLDCFGVPQ